MSSQLAAREAPRSWPTVSRLSTAGSAFSMAALPSRPANGFPPRTLPSKRQSVKELTTMTNEASGSTPDPEGAAPTQGAAAGGQYSPDQLGGGKAAAAKAGKAAS